MTTEPTEREPQLCQHCGKPVTKASDGVFIHLGSMLIASETAFREAERRIRAAAGENSET